MEFSRVNCLYFSPTGGVRKAAGLLCQGFGVPVKEWDLSRPEQDVHPLVFDPAELCVIAVPSFGGRVPAEAARRLRAVRGQGTPAVLMAVYGNRACEDTLTELLDLTQAQGFCCMGAVAAVAEHSIARQFAAGRPDPQDARQLADFARTLEQALERMSEPHPVEVPGNRPYKPYGTIPMTPSAGEACTRCGTCASLCPVQAIPAQDPRQTDAARCISCMRCVRVCPAGARGCDPAALEALVRRLSPLCAARKENKLFL